MIARIINNSDMTGGRMGTLDIFLSKYETYTLCLVYVTNMNG